MKTASRILGTAFFIEGYEVQDAPRYGAERRGAPISAYVRADRSPIHERGIIAEPDLIAVADESLLRVPSAGVLEGAAARTAVLIHSDVAPELWRHRLGLAARLYRLPTAALDRTSPSDRALIGAVCAGAAARLVGVIRAESLARSIREELSELGGSAVMRTMGRTMQAYAAMGRWAGQVVEGPPIDLTTLGRPAWIELPADGGEVASPTIRGSGTSRDNPTGLWRTLRPVIHEDRCRRCWWLCATFCPDGAVLLDDRGWPQIDYTHCKGCSLCASQCPHHAIELIPESLEEVGWAGGAP